MRPPYILSFVLNVKSVLLQAIKKQMILGIGKMEADDRALIYRPKIVAPAPQGQSVADIANYTIFEPFSLRTALRTIIQIAGNEDEEFEKVIFVIIDSFNEKIDGYGLQSCLQFDIDYDVKCKFKFCIFNKNINLSEICSAHPNCEVFQYNSPETLSQYILDQYESK